MAKGIIVVDMPESCEKCLMLNFHECCKLQLDYYVNFADQKAHCPIKPLPEKKDCQSRHGLLQEQIMVGWNMCIDEILGEDGQNDNTR